MIFISIAFDIFILGAFIWALAEAMHKYRNFKKIKFILIALLLALALSHWIYSMINRYIAMM